MKLKILLSALMALILVIGLTAGCSFVKETVQSYEDDAPADGARTAESENGQHTAQAPPNAAGCDDSIDGGNNPYVKGITTVTYRGETTAYEDQCVDDYLKEYYCDGYEYRSYKKLCAYGCENGACLQSTKVNEVPVQQTSPAKEEPVTEENKETMVPHCTNGYIDGDETDIDCGGSCKSCGYGKKCSVADDCMSPYYCNQRSKICSETKY